jgi:hypothetical protein
MTTRLASCLLLLAAACGGTSSANTTDDLALTGAQGVGAWVWTISDEGGTHGALADKLKQYGFTRVYVKIANGPSMWSEAHDSTIPAAYHARGIQCYAWSYSLPEEYATQARAITLAQENGYDGMVLDIETEFDGSTHSLTNLMQAYAAAKRPGFPLLATTWGNPADHNMRVDIIDQYVDAHLPQTYVEEWGEHYLADPARYVRRGTAEYRRLGAKKPIHHIISMERDEVSSAQLGAFLHESGPESSIWRVPGGGVSENVWTKWAGADIHTFRQAGSQIDFRLPVAKAKSNGDVAFEVSSDVRVKKVTYSAEDMFPLGESTDAAKHFHVDATLQDSGDRWVEARGYDATGQEVANQTIHFTVDRSFDLRFLTPTAGASVGNGATFSVSGSAEIVHVDYLAENFYELDSSDDAANGFPISYAFNELGARSITAKGYDAEGIEIATATIPFIVKPDATLAFSSPAQGATVDNPPTFRLTPPAGIVSVKYYAEDFYFLGEATAPDFALPYTFDDLGARTVTAKGYDASGAELAMGTIDFTVQ